MISVLLTAHTTRISFPHMRDFKLCYKKTAVRLLWPAKMAKCLYFLSNQGFHQICTLKVNLNCTFFQTDLSFQGNIQLLKGWKHSNKISIISLSLYIVLIQCSCYTKKTNVLKHVVNIVCTISQNNCLHFIPS